MISPIRSLYKCLARVAAWPERQILALLNANGIASLPHSLNRSLYEHLTGTRQILSAWSQAPEIQLAGLCHSIYSTEAYSYKAVPLSERSKVQRIIGFRAERLAFLFSAVMRQPLFKQIAETRSLKRKDQLQIEVRSDLICPDKFITGEEAAQLLILHLANMAEQTAEKGGRPGVWLNRFTRLARNLRKSDQLAPAVFAGCSMAISQHREMQVRDGYNIAVMNIQSDPDVADARLSECIQLCPYIAEPFIWKAYLLLQRGDTQQRIACSRQAAEILDKWGTAWDKRMECPAWKQTVQEISAGRLSPSTEERLAQIIELDRKHAVALHRAGEKTSTMDDKAQGVQRFFQYLNRISIEKSGSSVKVYPGLSRKEFHRPNDFSVVPALESSFAAIASEVHLLGEDGFHHEAERIKRTGDWKVFMLYEAGRKNAANCARCPTITRIIEEHECVRRSGGLIYISRLAPHTEVAPHRSPTNIRLRCHLAIKVPRGDCGMRVGRQIETWKEGKCIVFDDHYEHEVWNRTAEDRIVLLIDLWHADLTLGEKNALDAFFWYSQQQGLNLIRYWKNNEQQIHRENGTAPGLASTMANQSEVISAIDYLDH